MRVLIALLLAFFIASPALAADDSGKRDDAGKGGFVGPVSGAQAETVERAMKSSNDSRVVLTGHITSSIAGEKNEYVFEDATGEINVNITPGQFKGNIITPETRVRLSGKVEKEASSPDTARVKVRSLEVIK